MVTHGSVILPACGADRPGQPPGRLAIVRAIPPGSRRARSQRAYLAALAADPQLAELRSDARRTVMECARIWARRADWQTMTTWRPRARMCAEVGSSRNPDRPLSVTAYKAARRWLEEHGWLGLVSQGWTSSLRALALDDGTSVSAVFVLATPRRKPKLPSPGVTGPVNRPLTRSGGPLVLAPARARLERENQPHRGPRSARTAYVPPPAGTRSMTRTQIRSEGLAVAGVVIHRASVLRSLSREHVGSIIRPFVAAGWLPGDVLHAVNHEPGGRPHGYGREVRYPAGWLRHRLSLWLTGATPAVAPSQRRAADRAALLAEQQARRDERQRGAERAAEVDVAARAAAIREVLAGRGAAPRSA
jgi:hypothetical protein